MTTHHRQSAGRLGLLLLVAATATACATGVPSNRPGTPPSTAWNGDATDGRPGASKRKIERLPNGLSIVRLPGVPGTLRAMLVVAAGPADDPRAAPGLTELMVTMALEGTLGSEEANRARAEKFGGSIEIAADGGVAGWTLVGPAGQGAGLLNLLGDTLLVPAFPATRISAVAARMREDIESRDNAIVMTAVAVASGISLGRARPIPLQARGAQLANLNRESIVRHWAGLLIPSRIAIVVAGKGPGVERGVKALRARLSKMAVPKTPSADGRATVCQPSSRSAHLVLNPGGGLDHVFTLLAMPVPGRGDPSRPAVEAALASLAANPTGLLARKIGPERAFQAAPRIIDLGYGGGLGQAIALMRVSGPRKVALRELVTVLKMLTEFGKSPPEGELLTVARRYAAVGRMMGREGPIGSLVDGAVAALYGPGRAGVAARSKTSPTAKAVEWKTVVSDIFDPSSWVIVGVGPVQLAGLLEKLGPMSAWNSVGRFVGGAKPPGCKRRQVY